MTAVLDDIDGRRAQAQLKRDLQAADRAARRARKEDQRARRRQRRAERRVALLRLGGQLRPVAPISLVTGLAMYGQLAYAEAEIAPDAWPLPARLLLALALAIAAESVSLYVQWHAHDSLLCGHSLTAARLRRVSYLIAAGIGAINYTHFAGDGWAPTPAAVCFAGFSAAGPWLWGLHTRRAQRVQLSREGQADTGGAVFSAERWRTFPLRTWQARRWSIDHGVTDPRQAWEGFHAERAERREERQRQREEREGDQETEGSEHGPAEPGPVPVVPGPAAVPAEHVLTLRAGHVPTVHVPVVSGPALRPSEHDTEPEHDEHEPGPAVVVPGPAAAEPEPTGPGPGPAPRRQRARRGTDEEIVQHLREHGLPSRRQLNKTFACGTDRYDRLLADAREPALRSVQ